MSPTRGARAQFVIAPIASASSEILSSFTFAAKKRKRTASLTYAQIYGGITMNNLLVLGIFLALDIYAIYFIWRYVPETKGLTLEEITALLTATSNGAHSSRE